MNTNEQKKALLNLLKDTESWNALETKIKNPNIFDILKISKMEIRHSNMLAWLLDPNENHGIGDVFLREFIAQIESMDDDWLLKFLMTDLYSFQVYREYRVDSCPIDILLVSEQNKLVLAVENKLFSSEHKGGESDLSQLVKYRVDIKSRYPENKYKCAYIFLTPDGCPPSDDKWLVLEYEAVFKALEKIYSLTKSQLKEEVRILIKNYIEILKKEIIMDPELEVLCQRIYTNHRDALDLLFENRNDSTKRVSGACRNILKEYNDKQLLILEEEERKSTIKFWTQNLKEVLTKNEWTADNDNFYYQVTIKPKEMTLDLSFHKNKKSPLGKEIKDQLTNALKPHIKDKIIDKIVKNDDWEYKRLWSSKLNLEEVLYNDDGIEDMNDIIKNKIGTWLEKNLKKLPL